MNRCTSEKQRNETTIGNVSTVRWATLLLAITWAVPAVAQEAQAATDAAAEMARKLQDPLANIVAVMTDNDILFRTGELDDEVSYQFQIQPVKAFDFGEAGFNFIARGVIPVIGAAPAADLPPIGEPLPPGDSTTWGLGDIATQFFFSPKTTSAWKFGVGPQFTWKSRTDSKLGGPGWGAGPVGVIVGGFGANTSLAVITGNTWAFDGSFNTFLLQPMLFYNIEAVPGMAIGYNAAITADWKASSDNRWNVPLGLVISKTFNVAVGYGIDLSIGPYWNVVRPDGGADAFLKFGITLLLPS